MGAGVFTLIAPCFSCGRVFSSNPNLVPSYENKPICEDCIMLVNDVRRRNGLPEWPIPPGAYDPAESIG